MGEPDARDARIAELETRISQERAYTQMLEMDINGQVEKRLTQATASAELAGYQRGVADQGDGMGHEMVKAIEHALNKKVPELLATAIPEDLRGVLSGRIKPVVKYETYLAPDTLYQHSVTRVVIPETIIQFSHTQTDMLHRRK